MRAFQVTSFDAPPALSEISKPTPSAGEALIRIESCGLNFADLLMATGRYQDTPAPPFTLGLEMAGVVEAVGADVSAALTGKRVAVFAGHGGLAEYGAFPAQRCIPLPDEMSFDEAAGFQIAYGTSHIALSHKARLRHGETLLVLGAAGGVGLTAVELGKKMGARVIACARGEEKLSAARNAGADHLIDTSRDDLRARVKELGGADVIYDPVGGALSVEAFRACNPDGRIVIIGFASGDIPEFKLNHLLVKNISLIGLYWGGYLRFAPEVLTSSMAQLFEWYEDGGLRPHVSHLLPLDRASEGLNLLRERRSTGKVVIRCGE